MGVEYIHDPCRHSLYIEVCVHQARWQTGANRIVSSELQVNRFNVYD